MQYEIIRKRVKYYRIKIYPDLRVIVSAPLSATNKSIENFILAQKEWIEKTLDKLKKKNEASLPKKEKGIIILGKEVEVKIIDSSLQRIRLSENNLYVYTDLSSEEDIRDIIENWKKQKLKEILDKYIEKYCSLLQTKISYYKIKKMRATWGIHHSPKDYISFNINLIKKDESFIEYVVLHEICHNFHHNHGKKFWNLVEQNMPNYKEIIRKSKEY